MYTHSNSKCLKTLFAGMAICLSLRGLCSAKNIPVPRFLGLFEVEPVYFCAASLSFLVVVSGLLWRSGRMDKVV